MIGSMFHTLVPWAGAVLIAFIFYRSVQSLAGHYTFAQIGMNFLGDFKVSEGLAYVFGGGGVVYGIKHRKLHGDNLERMAGRIAELEKLLDSKRSSSRLTPRGKTRPEDKQ
ncbi:MAG TPA: hypothetical protein VG273_00110 [Bryobacteraceae bacterium]|nr:hypothetical protein [Bryobacteraceae bacterium]